MGDDPKTRVPKLVPGVDVRALPLGPLEGFLLSRIDGAVSVADLSALTGLGDEAVDDIVARLIELGAVTIGGGAVNRPRMSTPPSDPQRGASHVRTAPAPPDTPRALYDPTELHEDVDLDIDRRRLILDTFYRLEATNYYDLLGVEREADKKIIRAAYFDLSRTFHPDTMFRKNLGSYKQKMEQVFRKLTEAYETLGKKRTRDAYDEYLGLTAITSTVQRDLAEGERHARREAVRMGTPEAGIPRDLVNDSIPPGPHASSDPLLVPPSPAPVAAPTSPSATTPRPPTPSPLASPAVRPPTPSPLASPAVRPPTPSPMASTPRPPTPSPVPSPGPRPPTPPPSTTSPSTPRPATPWPAAGVTPPPSASSPDAALPGADERRKRVQELLSRRLQHVARSITPERAQPSVTMPAVTPQESAKDLARTLQQSATISGSGDVVGRHIATARAYEKEGKLIEAANALRLAVALAPDREDLAREHERVRLTLAQSLADTYEKQARYEEGVSKWQAAALSWAKVAEGRPDVAEPHWRSAEALLKSNGDLHRAQKLAHRAVELTPNDVRARVVLARVYLAAGMKLNAKRETDAAVALDPNHDLVKNLVRDVK